MKKEVRTICYDDELGMEAYRFQGIRQIFPNHFHEYYVIGIIEVGRRSLSCKNREYVLNPGDMILFNPGDNHTCTQLDDGTLDYRAINITKERMLLLTEEVTGTQYLPGFSENVIQNEEIACYFRPLHQRIMEGSHEFEKEEDLFYLLEQLISNYGQPFSCCSLESREGIQKACAYMEAHYAQHICLDEICKTANLSKSTLLRSFTKSKGVTPYRYLENIRINKAKELLEQGILPVDAAMMTGFSDQSHFTNYFSSFIGLSPGVYREIFLEKSKDNGGEKHGE